MTQKTFAVIGLGAISKKHIDSINKHGGSVKYSCDTNSSKYPDYKSYEDIPTDVDYVSICTPHGYHAEIAKHFLQNSNCKIIVEKPVVLTAYQFRQLHHYRDRIIPVLQNQLNPSYIEAKKLIKERYEFIQGCRISVLWNRPNSYYHNSKWRGTTFHRDDVITNQAIHLIHAASSLFKPNFNEFITNYCYKKNGRPKLIDVFTQCEFRIENKTGNYIQCSASVDIPKENQRTELMIITDHNTYKIDYTGKTNDYPGGYSGSMSLHSELYDDIINNEGRNLDIYDDAFAAINICERISKCL